MLVIRVSPFWCTGRGEGSADIELHRAGRDYSPGPSIPEEVAALGPRCLCEHDLNSSRRTDVPMKSARNGFVDWLDRGEHVLQTLQNNGVALKPGNRLLKHVQDLRQLHLRNPTIVETTQQEFGNVDLALNAIVIWNIICKALRQGLLRAPERLKIAVDGSVNSFDDTNQLAKSIEFELLVVSQLLLAGYKVISAEPDFIMSMDGIEVAIAAKRVTSFSQLSKRAAHGWKQIRRSGRPGILALELSRIIGVQGPSNVKVGLPAGDPLTEMHRYFKGYISVAEREMCPRRYHDHMVGLWAVACMNYFIPSKFMFSAHVFARLRAMQHPLHPWSLSLQTLARFLNDPTGLIRPGSPLAANSR